MNNTLPFLDTQSPPKKKGFALVIVLSLIALVTILVMAYLSRSESEYAISNASANSASSSILATTALEIIVNDLRQEIITSSTTPANTNYPVYVPKTPSNAMPARVGTDDSLPNLVKRSADGKPFDGATGAARASSVSTGTASIEGRTFSADRWNAARLLPTASGTSVTPVSTFTLPDWIYLTRSGSNCTGSAVAAANKSNGSDPILGRFAYAIYDEGGLLDVNCAGYPSGPSGLAATEVAKKGYLALADLTKSGLTSAQVQSLVAWRNASTVTQPTNFLTNLRMDPSNFRQVAQGDQAFVSRRQLLNFFTQNSWDPSPLQLLGTFSRGLNQPSLGVVGPTIPATAASMPTQASGGAYSLASYAGNNLAKQSDQTDINPRLLDVRVSGTFNRFNPAQTSGSATLAKVSDALIAKRFPLNRLAWLTYKGPIAPGGTLTTDTAILTPLHNAGLTDDFLKLGTEQNILKAFGLTWASDPAGTGHNVWVYDHGDFGNRVIGRLSDAATNAREPDFLELLKASIHIGSLGKGAANSPRVGLWQHARDIQPDFQLLQIFANIIDQYDSDGYPTEIALPARWTDADLLGLFERKVRGVENLPYLYSMNIGVITLRQPQFSPPLTPLPLNPTPLGSNKLTDPGLAADMVNPWIWNPHSSLSGTSSAQPTSFRIIMFSGDPIHPSATPLMSLGVVTPYTSGSDPLCQVAFPKTGTIVTNGNVFSLSPYPATSSDPTELDFRVPGAGYFTQPTALIFPNVPAGTNLKTGANNTIKVNPLAGGNNGYLTDPDNNQQYVGVLLGTFPICATQSISGTNYLLTANRPSGDYGHSVVKQQRQATWLLQYDSGGSWITYDFKSYEAGVGGFSSWGYIDPGKAPHDPVQPGDSGGSSGSYAVSVDPRTMRFGLPMDMWDVQYSKTINVTNASIQTLRSGTSGPANNGAIISGNKPGDGIGSSMSTMGWIANTISGAYSPPGHYYPQFLPENNATLPNAYNDPDGIGRGGMAFKNPGASTFMGEPLATTTGTNDTADISRPVILNRPFRSVAELGYVYRDQPFKQLDFFTPESGDSALLDSFCIKEDQTTDGVMAGKVNLNTRNAQVLDAVLAGVGRDLAGSTPITSPESTTLATAIRDWTKSTGAFTSLGDLVGRYRNSAYESFFKTNPTPFTGGSTNANNILQRYREAPIRALSDVGEVRVWNLLIDVVAQSGFCGPQASTLNQFSLRGETHLWIHLAIDRATGVIVDQQTELVTE